MIAFDSLQALRRANPRRNAGFEQSVEAAAYAVRVQIQADAPVTSFRPRRRVLGLSAAGAVLVAAAVVAAFLTVGSPRGPVENAEAAFRKAATTTAASAERSGIATVRVTRGGAVWAGSTIRWHGDDLAVSSEAPQRAGRPGSALLVVDGMMYGIEDGRWVELGSPESIDPGSGTTPAEYLAAVREDVGGTTLHRITNGMTGLTTRRLEDGSTAYSGTIEAGLIARETGFKEGRAIRVLPFGYVAHDEAAEATSRLDAAVTVGGDGVVRELGLTWGTWTYTVTYRKLGSTSAPVAPTNARPLKRRPG